MCPPFPLPLLKCEFSGNCKNVTIAEVWSDTNKSKERLLIKSLSNRKEKGLSLSDRVWQYTNQFKDEIEMSLDIGLRQGHSAAKISRDVRQYLNHPNSSFANAQLLELSGVKKLRS